MDVNSYLQRIEFRSRPAADRQTLFAVHRAHILSVPFENLDITPLHRAIRLDQDSLWDKIVVRNRGGFCYELNGMFAWLLEQIGYRVNYLNGRVARRDGSLGIQFDHLALDVSIPGQTSHWLADVGFGDSFIEPLDLGLETEQIRDRDAYLLERNGEGYFMRRRNAEGIWERQYYFDLLPRDFPTDYEAAARFHSTSPQSSFTRKGIISLARPDGRITLEPDKLITTTYGLRKEEPVKGQEEYDTLLRDIFGIILDPP